MPETRACAKCTPTDNDQRIVKIDGNKATVGYLVSDEDAGPYYFAEPEENGEYLNFDKRTIHSRDMVEPEELAQLIADNPGRVFWINKYDHSLVSYYRSGDALAAPGGPSRGNVPDAQWDESRGVALYIAPDDCPDPAAYCDSTMEQFSDWVNGNIYGVVVERFTRPDADSEWESDGDEDACWHYIGTEHAEQSLKEEMGGA